MTPGELESREIDLPSLGAIVAGKYELVRVIGKGGMGIVYEAKHLRLNQRVAIKMLRPAALHIAEFKPRFEREARTAALLRGRHVARIFDVDTTETGLPFMVMEYLVGRDLDAELRERGTISVMEATGYVLQACIAMQEAHAAGIVHRDLKPANLFLTEENGERVVKVLDFGISKLTTEVDTHLTGTFATVGTPLYMSPEQVRSSRSVDARTDIWSLAVILFEALAGQPPFHGSMTATAAAIVADKTPSLCALRPDVSVEFEAALARALEKHPNRRYQDVGELSAALAPFGPPRLPAADGSNPVMSPISSPSLSRPVLGGGSGPEVAREWSAAAETMVIPDEERRGSVRPTTKAKTPMPLAALGLGLAALVLAGVFFLRPKASAPLAAGTTPSSSASSPPPVTSAAATTQPVESAPAVSAALPPAPTLPPEIKVVKAHSAPAPGYALPSRPVASVHPPVPPPPPAPRPPPPAANPIFLQ